jgi:hypothetical protein
VAVENGGKIVEVEGKFSFTENIHSVLSKFPRIAEGFRVEHRVLGLNTWRAALHKGRLRAIKR